MSLLGKLLSPGPTRKDGIQSLSLQAHPMLCTICALQPFGNSRAKWSKEAAEKGMPPEKDWKLGCQDVGKGYSPSFSLLTGGRKQKQANMLKTRSRKEKKYSLATLQESWECTQGPAMNRALLVSKHSSSSQSQQVRHAAQVLVR